MKMEVLTTSPKQLVAAIDKAMNAEELKTWKIVKTSKDEIRYTHTPSQWEGKALIAALAEVNKVVFSIRHWDGKPEPTMDDKGYYFGRFTEVLLVHFRNYFTKLEVIV